MAARIVDVAAEAGVSVATVSRALRNLSGVSQPTQERVLAAARRLGYVLASTPPGAATGAGRRIAVVAPGVGTWFLGGAIGALAHRLADRGYRVDLNVIAGRAERNVFFAAASLNRRVSGVVIVGMSLSDHENASLASLEVPVVGLHSGLEPFPSVLMDDEGMARLAAGHLIGLGHRRIAMITSAPGRPVPHLVPARRTAGFRSALTSAGIRLDPGREVCGEDSIAGGGLAMSRLLSAPPFPTAVFVHTDEMAFGAIAALRCAGLDVPRDVSVVSIDDHELASPMQLTTVAQHVGQHALIAADLLVLALNDRPGVRPVHDVRPVRPEPQLVVRGTTAPPRAHRRRRNSGRVSGETPPERGTAT